MLIVISIHASPCSFVGRLFNIFSNHIGLLGVHDLGRASLTKGTTLPAMRTSVTNVVNLTTNKPIGK